MAMRIELDEEPINTTPMIDIVFNLLVFFMLSATFMQEEQGLEVQLRRVAAATPLTDAPEELSVQVGADGRMVVGGRELTGVELVAKLKAAVANYPDQSVAVRGHRQAPYEAVVRVFSL